MTEIELRFQIRPAQWPAVRQWVMEGGDTPPRSERLRASYFDTPARDLARAGFALRLRLEGDTWVQTLKGAAPDGMTRLEHNVPVAGEAPTLDLQRHADHPAGRGLLALLAALKEDDPATELQALFHTDITRVSAHRSTPFGDVELALDHGALLSGEGDDERRTPVAELEIELKDGQPRAVLEMARDWAVREFGLTLELRTKALRGDLLSRGKTMAPVMPSRALAWAPGQTRSQALRALLAASIEPVAGNASQIISGPHEAEHLHQLRVALRRLRVAVELLADEGDIALRSVAEGARQLSHALTAARDADAQAGARWRGALEKAWQRVAVAVGPAEVPLAPVIAPDPAALLSEPVWQDWMLSLIAWMALDAEDDTPVEQVGQRLDGLAHKALRLAKRFDQLDAEGRHHLRRRLRRWKLALELCAGLALPGHKHGAKDQRKALKRVQAVQQRLGVLNDLEVGLARARATLVRAVAEGDAHAAARAGFEQGWLTPRRDEALVRAARRVKQLKR